MLLILAGAAVVTQVDSVTFKMKNHRRILTVLLLRAYLACRWLGEMLRMR